MNMARERIELKPLDPKTLAAMPNLPFIGRKRINFRLPESDPDSKIVAYFLERNKKNLSKIIRQLLAIAAEGKLSTAINKENSDNGYGEIAEIADGLDAFLDSF
jgi:hypothetical protein